MPFCGKCGAEVPEGTKFCGVCGAEVAGGSTYQTVPAEVPLQTSDAKDATDNKWMGILAYIGPLVFVPMFAAKTSKFARYHTVQGFNLFLVWVAYTILFSLLGLIRVTRTQEILGFTYNSYQVSPPIIGTIALIVSLLISVFAIIGIVNAANGAKKELPIIGKLHILDSFMKPSV